MTLQQLNYALTISKLGSMNKAAEKLYVSQPALTKALQELETEIGINIFNRTSKGVVETNEGIEFLQYARQLYNDYELINDKYSFNGGVRRKFCVSAQHYSFAVQAFVETVKRFNLTEYEYAIRETMTYNVIKDVEHRRSEIGIIYRNEYNKKLLDRALYAGEMEFHELVHCKAYVYLSKKHPLAKKKIIKFEELKGYPCLSFEQGENGSLFMAEELLSDREYDCIIKASDRATMINLMEGLNGYTLCSGITCDELNGSDYCAIPLDDFDEEDRASSEMDIGYIKKIHTSLSEHGKAYIEEIEKYLENFSEK